MEERGEGNIDMSNLGMLPVKQLKDICNLTVMIETGAEAGYGIDVGLKAGFEHVYSCEIINSRYEKLLKKYETEYKVLLFSGDSKNMLSKMICAKGDENALYWLDAHLPNCHDPSRDYDIRVILPMRDELELLRDSGNDVICIDDLCLFDSKYRGKDFDLQHWTGNKGERDFAVDEIKDFMPDHEWVIDMRQEGILIGIPKSKFQQCNYLYNMYNWITVK